MNIENETTTAGEAPEPEGTPQAFSQIQTLEYQTLLPSEAQEAAQLLGNDNYLSSDEKAHLPAEAAQAAAPTNARSTGKKSTETKIPAEAKGAASRLGLPQLNVIPGGPIANFWHNFRRNFFLRTTRHSPKPKSPLPVQPRPSTPANSMHPTRYTWEQVEKQLAKYGITKERLEQSGGLTDFLNGRRTGVIQFERTWEAQKAELTGKLYLVNTPDKGLRVHFQTVKQTLTIPETYLGYAFDAADRQNLHKRGELGKLVKLKDKISGQVFKGYVGVDRETNSLTVLRRDRFAIPQTIKGVTLTPEQQAGLEAGKAVKLAGLMGQDGKPFDAYVQVSASKRSLSFAKIPVKSLTQALPEAKNAVEATEKRRVSATSKGNQPAEQPNPPKQKSDLRKSAPNPRKGPKR